MLQREEQQEQQGRRKGSTHMFSARGLNALIGTTVDCRVTPARPAVAAGCTCDRAISSRT